MIAELAIKVESDVARAVDGMNDVGGAAAGAASDVARMGQEAEDSARRLNINADSADEMAGKTGKATGALGALAGGLEAVGLEKYAAGLQTAAVATDFASGAGDALNLVMESTILKNARQTVSTIASSVATKAAAAGTAVMTGAQWALNAAMSANPIALVVIAVLALVAGVVIAYQRSDRFREIIQSVGRVGRAAIGGLVDVVMGLVGWVREKLPAAGNVAKNLLVTYFTVMTIGPRTLYGIVVDIVTWVRDKIPGAFQTAKNKAGEVKDALLSPFQGLFDLVEKIIQKIQDMIDKANSVKSTLSFGLLRVQVPGDDDFPGPPAPPTGPGGFPPGAYVDQRSYSVSGVVDIVGAYQQLKQLMERGDRVFGPPLGLAP